MTLVSYLTSHNEKGKGIMLLYLIPVSYTHLDVYKRQAKDPGRIKFLTVSIHTIKGIKIVGVPIGTK